MATKAKSEKPKRLPPLQVRNAKLRFMNFAGVAKKYNAKGLRNFHIVLDNDDAKNLERDGWNVRWHEPKNEGDQTWASIKVAVRFDHFPPRVLMIFKGQKVLLDEETIGMLDSAEIVTADIIVTASPYTVDGKSGYKAYLQKGFFTLSDDDLEAQYFGANAGLQTVDDAD